MNPTPRRRSREFRPSAESCEARQLLAAAPLAGILHMPGFFHPERPNTPVLPFGANFNAVTFIDPSAHILQPKRMVLATHTYVAPFAVLDARAGYLKVGDGSAILDNAQVLANPTHRPGLVGATIGDSTVIAQGAKVLGNSAVGAFGSAAKTTFVGPNATIDNATVAPGAYVGALAYVGPGVTIPAGHQVLPGASVTSQAEVTGLAPGKVALAPSSLFTPANTILTDTKALANGYATLVYGNKSTGTNIATTNSAYANGSLAPVEGAGPEPGSTVVKFEPAMRSPSFPAPHLGRVQANLVTFPARAIGGVDFGQRPALVAHRLGRRNSIRGDVGQPIAIASIARTGNNVSIHAPQGGSLTIGNNFRAGDGAVILGGNAAVLGDNVTVGRSAVVSNSSLGAGTVVGAGAYVANSTLPPGTVVPDGAVIVNRNRTAS